MNEKPLFVGSDSYALYLQRTPRSFCCPLLKRCVHLTWTEYRLCEALFQDRLLSDEQLARMVFACPVDRSVKGRLDKIWIICGQRCVPMDGTSIASYAMDIFFCHVIRSARTASSKTFHLLNMRLVLDGTVTNKSLFEIIEH